MSPFASVPRSWNRRTFLAAGAALASTAPFARMASGKAGAGKGTLLAYCGTFSSPQGPEGSKGNGQGIYLLEMDTDSGALRQRELVLNENNPSWLALNASHTHLYSANEVGTFEGKNSGSVSAYAVDRSTGKLKLLNTVSSEGAGPTHLSVHPSGKYILVANYAGGSVAVLPVQEGGSLGPATDVKQDEGEVGAKRATSAPPGSFAISGHDRSHAHMIESDPSGRYVFANDLGLDRILSWKFDVAQGKLSPTDPAFTAVPTGDGPRHFVFHPNGKVFYSLQEEGSTVSAFGYDGETGKLRPMQTLSTLPSGFAGTNFTSEIRISSDARFLYVGNRLHDSIAYFSVARDGKLAWVGETWTRGDYPRSFTIDPSGRFLCCCNQRGDALTTFRRNGKTGELTFTGQYAAIGTPSMVVFLA